MISRVSRTRWKGEKGTRSRPPGNGGVESHGLTNKGERGTRKGRNSTPQKILVWGKFARGSTFASWGGRLSGGAELENE